VGHEDRTEERAARERLEAVLAERVKDDQRLAAALSEALKDDQRLIAVLVEALKDDERLASVLKAHLDEPGHSATSEGNDRGR
jgi:hypothetical protein